MTRTAQNSKSINFSRAQIVPIDRNIDGNLRFIRETMERAASFTAISGWGQVFTAVTALAAAGVAASKTSPESWLLTWLIEGALAAAISTAAPLYKAHKTQSSLRSGAGRKFLFNFLPPMFAGAFLTGVLVSSRLYELLPGTWLLLFGTGVVTGGAFSVRAVPIMGLCFMALGSVALFLPLGLSNIFMALGFGIVFGGFGLRIALRYGG